jgi:pimeloyl-ACP methyl ester carboxylesterase
MPLRVEFAGDPAAPAVVFLHGLGVSSWMWAEQVRHLSGGFHCVTIDLPGSGASHQVPWRSLDDSAAAVAAVIAATPAGRAHVVGLSLGGYVAVTLAARHPDVVGNVVVSGVTAEPLSQTWPNRLLVRAGSAVMRRPRLARAYGTAMRMPREARDAMAGDARVLSAATTGRVYDEILPFALPALGAHAARVLAVAADHDARSIRRGLDRFAAAGATVALARDAHHAWNAEHPRLFSDMVEAWVTDRAVTPGLVAPPTGQAGLRLR